MKLEHESLKEEFKTVTNKLKKMFIIDNFLMDDESKSIYAKFRKGELPAIKVILPSGGSFVYSSMGELEAGLSVIFDSIDYGAKISFKEVSDLESDLKNIVNEMFDTLE